MSTYEDLMSKESPSMKKRIEERVEKENIEIIFTKLREELKVSQKEVAKNMGVKQPSIARMENKDNDLRLSTIKRYIEAMGGKLSLDIELPTGKKVAFTI